MSRGSCTRCGASVTRGRIAGHPDEVAFDTAQVIATPAMHDGIYRLTDEAGVFEPVTRPGQVGQTTHLSTCPDSRRN